MKTQQRRAGSKTSVAEWVLLLDNLFPIECLKTRGAPRCAASHRVALKRSVSEDKTVKTCPSGIALFSSRQRPEEVPPPLSCCILIIFYEQLKQAPVVFCPKEQQSTASSGRPPRNPK